MLAPKRFEVGPDKYSSPRTLLTPKEEVSGSNLTYLGKLGAL